MTNKLRALIALSAIALPVFGSDLDSLHITVPFAFKAGKMNLPAGAYTVTEQDSRVVTIKGEHGSAILLGVAGADTDADKAGLSFERNEAGYCLKSVHAWGKSSLTTLPAPAAIEK